MVSPIISLKINTLFSQLIPLDTTYPEFTEVWGYLDTLLSYEVQNSAFIKAMSNSKYIRDIWDGREHLFNAKTGKFLTGLLPYVQEALEQFEIPHEVIDHRPEYSAETTPYLLSNELDTRKYQVESVETCIKEKRGVIHLQPRAGKTIIEIMLVAKLNIFPVLSICQSIDIARQTIDKFKQFLPDAPVGLIGDGVCDIQPITVATIQSLSMAYKIKDKFPKGKIEQSPPALKRANIKDLVERAKFIWVDECFPKGVKVLIDTSSYMPIEKIVENSHVTHVLSYDLKTRQVIQKRILRKIKIQKPRKLMHFAIEVDRQIKTLNCTRNHKIWTTNGYVQAKDLVVGDELKYFGTFDNEVNVAKVVKVRKFREAATVYNLEVEDNHNYFANGILVSNCHHAASSTYKHILQYKTYAAEYILGCSGTPYREDNTDLLISGLLGPIIYEVNYSKLIEGNYLVRPTIHLVQIPRTLNISDNLPYSSLYKQAISENTFRNDTIAKIARALTKKNKTCMILVNKIGHGKTLKKLIPNAEFSYSKTKNRGILWKRLKERVLPCLITTLGDEGIDIASLDAIIIAAGGKSAIKVFQRLRCMTPYPGKKNAIVVDFMDPYKYLSVHSKKREKLYKSEPSFIINYKKA